MLKDGHWECEACGAPALVDVNMAEDERVALSNASQYLRICNFEKAQKLYMDIMERYPNNPEGYWGYTLAKFSIKYEKDYKNETKPSCYETNIDSILKSEYYKKAIQLAKGKLKDYYEEQANILERIRLKCLEEADKQPEWDVFLSYKANESGDDSINSQDRIDAYKLYWDLVKHGYKVFFADETLNNRLGEDYEPVIFNAINKAYTMIVYGSKLEYFTSPWIMNEWRRFLKRIERGEKKSNSLLVVYKNINPKDLPAPLDKKQAIKCEFGAMLDLFEVIDGILKECKVVVPIIKKNEIHKIDVANDKSYEKINKKALKGRTNKHENISLDNSSLEKREIGTYNVTELKQTAEGYYNYANMYLEREDYDAALKNFEKVLSSDPRSGKALLGKFLAIYNIKRIENIANIDFVNFQSYELLTNIINYSSKDIAEKVLNVLTDKCLRILDGQDTKTAKELYTLIKDYDVECVHSMHNVLLEKETTRIAELDDNEYDIIDNSLEYLSGDIKKYNSCLRNILKLLLLNRFYDRTKKYLDLFSKSNGEDYDYYSFELRYRYREITIEQAIQSCVRQRNINHLEDIVNSVDIKSANKLLSSCTKVIYDYLDVEKYEDAYTLTNFVIQIDFDERDLLIHYLLNHCVEHASIAVENLFDLALMTLDNDDPTYIKYNELYANYALQKGEFASATKYYNELFAYDQNNEEYAYGVWYSKIGCISGDYLKDNINKTEDFSIVEHILCLQKNREEIINTNNIFVDVCIEYVENNKEISKDDKIFAVFERLLSYYPENVEAQLSEKLICMANACLANEMFDFAEKYFAMICGNIDKENPDAYWGLLLAKLKCKDNDELIHQMNPIGEQIEFENACVAASIKGYEEVLSSYVNLKIEQDRWIKKEHERQLAEEARKKRQKKIKIVSFSSVALVALIVTAILFAFLLFIPMSNYNKAVELLEQGDYLEAAKYLDKTNGYWDSSEQGSIINAYKAFDCGDYEQGIDYIYNIGGTVNITYDGNGGTPSTPAKQIRKLNAYINDTATRPGCIFDGWEMQDFSISNEKGNYSATVKLVSMWRLVKYNVQVELAGGQSTDKFPKTYDIEHRFSLSNPTRTGYDFLGWSINKSNDYVKDYVMSETEYGNLSFRAMWQAQDYSISLDGDSEEFINQELNVTYDNVYTLPTPVKTGYKFLGWYDSNNTKVESDVWYRTSDLALKAKWEIITYTIKYELANGSMATIEYDVLCPDFTLNNPAKIGYTFTGWICDNVNVGNVVTIPQGSTVDKIYNASWELIQYNITYEGLNGIISSDPTQYNIESNDITLSNSLDRTGYVFEGWVINDNDNPSKNLVIEKGSYGDKSFTAKWSAISYNISYTYDKILTNNCSYPHNYTIESENFSLTPLPTTEGYDFDGWIGTGLDGYSEPPKVVTIVKGSYGDREYTATWKPKKYKITYVLNDGHYLFPIYENNVQEVEYDSQVITRPVSKDGYTLEKWTLEDGTTFNNGLWNRTSDITIYANWEVVNYSLDYTNLLNAICNNPYSYNIESDTFKLNYPTKTGYEFIGWTEDENEDLVLEVLIEKGSVGDRTFKANWRAKTYTITFIPNEGELSILQKEVTYDAFYTLPSPTRTAYSFTGWFDNQAQQYQLSSIWKTTDNVILTAGWQPIEYYINYDFGCGLPDIPNNPTNYTIENSIELINPIRRGYTFTGWTGTGLSETTIHVEIAGSYGNRSYLAHWTANSYSVHLDSTEGTISNSDVNVIFDDNYAFEIPIRYDDYEFAGWYMEEEGVVSDIASSGKWIISHNVTLYARWQRTVHLISSKSDFESIRTNLSGHFKINNDIDFNSSFVPIGTVDNPFTGEFDGNNYTLTNVATTYSTIKVDSYFGLFGYCDSASISNVNINHASIDNYNYECGTYEYVGFIVGYGKDTIIDNCSVTNALIHLEYKTNDEHTSASNVGLLAGYAYQIINCHGSGSISADNCGGLVGTVDIIEQCTSSVLVSGLQLGGIANYVKKHAIKCMYDGNIVGQTFYSQDVSIRDYCVIGGISAYYGDEDENTIFEECSYVGMVERLYGVECNADSTDLGGIVGCYYGTLTSNLLIINNSYSTGKCDSPGGTWWSYVGGLVGHASNVLINNCYSSSVVYSVSRDNSYSGGLIGYCTNATINNSFTLNNPTGTSVNGCITVAASFANVYENLILTNSYYAIQGETNSDRTFILQGEYKESSELKSYFIFDELGFDQLIWKVTNNNPILKYFNHKPIVITYYLVTSTLIDYTEDVQNVFSEDCVSVKQFIPPYGYEFLGWALTVDGDVVYAPNSEINVGLQNIVLYSIIRPIRTTVSFITAGGNIINPVELDYASDYLFEIPIKEGYEFIGWNFGIMGNNIIPISGTWFEISNCILLAKWSANLNSITFCGNGNTSGTMDIQYLHTDEVGNIYSNCFTKTGYHFIGWSTTSDGDVVFFDGQEYTMGPESNSNLYAKWEPNNYTITFNGNNGSVLITQQNVLYDNNYALPIPVRQGYDFDGWYCGNEQLTNENGESLHVYNVTGNITVVAQWQAKLNVIILKEDDKTTQTYGYTDSIIRLPAHTIEKDNQNFLGWAETASGEIKYSDEDLFVVGVLSSQTLYGKWFDLSDYFPIRTYEDLCSIDMNGKYYLANDIDCNNQRWIPLGGINNPFKGEIYGFNHTIYNLDLYSVGGNRSRFILENNTYVERSGTKIWTFREYGYFGFISVLASSGLISDINLKIKLSGTLEGVRVDAFYVEYTGIGRYYFGGLCGQNNGTITNCSVDLLFDSPSYSGTCGNTHGHATCYAYFNGICGENNGTLTSCFSSFSGKKITSFNGLGSSSPNYYGGNGSGTSYYVFDFNGTVSPNGSTNGLLREAMTPIQVFQDGTLKLQTWTYHSSPFTIDSLYAPIKQGYTHIGWNYNNIFYEKNSKIYPNGDSLITIEPVFAPNENSLVLINEATGESNSVVCSTGEKIILPDILTLFEAPEGYHFIGWSTTSDGDVVFFDGQEYTMGPESNYDLYAKWEPNTNQIAFYNNGGYGEMNSQQVLSNETVTLSKCLFEAPSGFYFEGWSSNPNGVVEYNDCDSFTAGTVALYNLYAIWKEI